MNINKQAFEKWISEVKSNPTYERTVNFIEMLELEIQSGRFDSPSGPYTVRRGLDGYADAIERDGYTVLHLQSGTERNEQEVEGIVARLNEADRMRTVLNRINKRIADQRRWGAPVNLEIARELQAVADEIKEALSITTEPTGAERVREIDELMAIHKEKISYHRQNGNLTQEYFYRGYNAALHRERNRLVGVGINAEGEGKV